MSQMTMPGGAVPRLQDRVRIEAAVGVDEYTLGFQRIEAPLVQRRLCLAGRDVMQGERSGNHVALWQRQLEEVPGHATQPPLQPLLRHVEHAGIGIDAHHSRIAACAHHPARKSSRPGSEIDDGGAAFAQGCDRGRGRVEHLLVIRDESADRLVVVGDSDSKMCCNTHDRLSAISYRLSAFSYRLSAFSYQLSACSFQFSAIGSGLQPPAQVTSTIATRLALACTHGDTTCMA